MKFKWKNTFLASLLFAIGVEAKSDSGQELSLEDLMSVKVNVATGGVATTLKEAPGIISVVTAEQIKEMNARDLMDVLRTLPGFSFGQDVQGVIGVSMRSLWANEGKVLLVIDDIEMNELMYSTLQFGNHIPVDNIEKIEIIRGPGSALYGGYAELGVIKITTKSGIDLEGVDANVFVGQPSEVNGVNRWGANLLVGQGDEDMSWTISGLYAQAVRSNEVYRDIYGTEYNMESNSDFQPTHVNSHFKYGDFTIQAIIDQYGMTQRDEFDEALSEPVDIHFNSYSTMAKYNWSLSDKFELMPKLSLTVQEPWKESWSPSAGYDWDEEIDAPNAGAYNGQVMRTSAELRSIWFITEAMNLTTGVRADRDLAVYRAPEGYDAQDLGEWDKSFADGSEEFEIVNFAAYSQFLLNHDIANLTLGGRFETNSEVGNSFVPRIAVTKAWESVHVKALVSKAFRAPGLENINANKAYLKNNPGSSFSEMVPEKMWVYELELGYAVNENLQLVTNVFDIQTTDPIVYFYDENADDEGYRNFPGVGSQGLEFQVNYLADDFDILANYSISRSKDNYVGDYKVDANDEMVLGIPSQKAFLKFNYRFFDGINIQPSVLWIGPKYGALRVDDDEENSIVKKMQSTTLVNLVSTWNDVWDTDLYMSLGLYNLLDERDYMVQPYDGWHSPMPIYGRDFQFKLGYNYMF